MPARLMPRLRSYGYRAFTQLPFERVDAWRERSGPRTAVAGLQSVLSRGAVEIGGGMLAGWLLDARALELTHMQARGIVRGEMEAPVQEALRRHVFAGATVYDVGANIGFFSLLAAQLAGPEGAVEAFEPLPAAAEGLRRNVVLNGVDTVSVHEVAVGAKSGPAQLMAVEQGAWSHLAERGHHPRTQQVLDVEVVTIDELVAGGTRAPDVLKIDVEGSELDVLAGMAATIRARKPVIICELHETNAAFLEHMDALGYVTSNLDGPQSLATAGYGHALSLPAG